MYLLLAMFDCKFQVGVPEHVESRGLVAVLVGRGPHGLFQGLCLGVEGPVLALQWESDELLLPQCALY